MKTIKTTIATMLALPILGVALSTLSSCTEADSSLVEYEEYYHLDSPNDTVYSVAGILGKMQALADRTVLLGELRGDLTVLTPEANTNLQAIANFDPTFGKNPYNQPKDYYAVIQNCNYFIAKADSLLAKRGEKVFSKELAAVHSFRAWTYLQLALNYGEVPFFTEPILTEKDAYPSAHKSLGIEAICNYFIDDLKPYVDTKFPDYLTTQSFLPVRVLLGDLCLWAGHYSDAANYYHDYLNHRDSPRPLGVGSVTWTDFEFRGIIDSYTSTTTSHLAAIVMAEDEYEGNVSELEDIFNSTEKNNYYYQVTKSDYYLNLSKSQTYTMVYTDPVTELRDTITPPDTLFVKSESYFGDLRLSQVYDLNTAGITNTTYNKYRQTFSKTLSGRVGLYRIAQIYLRYAEALNRAGFPESAFAVLKYGLCNDNNAMYLSESERNRAGNLISFNPANFTRTNTQGLHARGCGDVYADTLYAIPATCTTLQDSILFVEDKIIDETALEAAGEGLRYYDLMRIALRRNDPSYLAVRVAQRKDVRNPDYNLLNRLSTPSNWYLNLPQ